MERRLVPAIIAVLLALLVGCAHVPTSGPVRVEPQRTHAADQPIDIIPHRPQPGDAPQEIVQGFLHAMAEGSGQYDVARSYLTAKANERWQPADRALVYTAASEHWTIDGGSAVLEAETLGVLDRRGSFTRSRDPYRLDFALEQVDGQWRIGNPPAGLLLLQDLYDHTFLNASLYFFDPTWRVLVPDLVHVPKLRRTPTWLVEQLLAGATERTRPGVRNAIPAGAALSGDVTVTSDGVATIPLSGDLSPLDVTGRTLLAAEVAATLAANTSSPQVQAIRLVHEGAPFPLPGADTAGVLAVSELTRFLPENLQASRKVFGIKDDRVVAVTDTTSGATVEPLPGQLGESGRRLSYLAVAPDSSSITLVGDDRRQLWASNLVDGQLKQVLLTDGLIAPQQTRFSETFAMAATSEGTRVYRIAGGEATLVDAPDLAGVEVLSFRLSPDATRLAAVVRRGTATQLLLLQVRKAERTQLGGATVVDLGPQGPTSLSSVAWRSETTMVLLGSEEGAGDTHPWEVAIDSSFVRRTSTQTWDATRLVTTPYGGYLALAIGPSGQVWRRGSDTVWRRWVNGLSAVTIAG